MALCVPTSVIGVATRCGRIQSPTCLIASRSSVSAGTISEISASAGALRKSLYSASRIAFSFETIASRSRSSFAARCAGVVRLIAALFACRRANRSVMRSAMRRRVAQRRRASDSAGMATPDWAAILGDRYATFRAALVAALAELGITADEAHIDHGVLHTSDGTLG